MRDEVEYYHTETLTRENVDGTTTSNTTSRYARRSYRSDAMSTTRLPDGSYVYPTTYKAFFGTSFADGGELFVRRRSFISGQGNVTRTCRFTYTGYTGPNPTYGMDLNGVPAVPSAIRQQAKAAAIAAIKANDLDVGQFLGEARESARMVGGMIVQAVKLLHALLRVLRGKSFPGASSLSPPALTSSRPRDMSKRVAQAYLGYMYGIRPLMADIYGIIDALSNGLAKLPVGQVKQTRTTTIPPPAVGLHRVVKNYDYKLGCTVSYTFAVTNGDSFQLWRYGITNPLSLAWELFTLSFVADWFTGVGSFLSGLQRPLGLTVLHGYESLWLDGKLNLDADMFEIMKSSTSEQFVGGKRICSQPVRAKGLQRYVLNSIGIPLPYLDLDLNLNQALAGIALLVART